MLSVMFCFRKSIVLPTVKSIISSRFYKITLKILVLLPKGGMIKCFVSINTPQRTLKRYFRTRTSWRLSWLTGIKEPTDLSSAFHLCLKLENQAFCANHATNREQQSSFKNVLSRQPDVPTWPQ
ncbi:uncharacterized protein LOC108036871 [Drosophila biarmipes]|uniref:uncharacterized protein LOC108036871 n=1 Tax=Drosophila biarmipes TaxID=125945 RepID=UPI0021CD0C55|nr:uncharacterized protein LOC108036871 [Drosophila biarmipes]